MRIAPSTLANSRAVPAKKKLAHSRPAIARTAKKTDAQTAQLIAAIKKLKGYF